MTYWKSVRLRQYRIIFFVKFSVYTVYRVLISTISISKSSYAR